VKSFDLWGDTDATPAAPPLDKLVELKEKMATHAVALAVAQNRIMLVARQDLTQDTDFGNLLGVITAETEPHYVYDMRLGPVNAYVLRRFLRGMKVHVDTSSIALLAAEADTIPAPTASLAADRKHIELVVPQIKVYKEVMRKVGAYPTTAGYRVDITKAFDLEAISETLSSRFPPIAFSSEVLKLNREPIVGYDGSLESLKALPISSLHVVQANGQTWKAMKTSKKTLEEKFQDFGIATLHDLLFFLPRRYIDKSRPQEIRDLIVGEPATVVGVIESIGDLPNNMGVFFRIATGAGESIRVTFFRQGWLKAKFFVGTEVLVTGKFSYFNGTPQLNGSSIESTDEAAILPIVPIYKQSESRGITTRLIMAAARELLSRVGTIALPVYFKKANRLDYYDAIQELHFPTSLARHYEAIDTLAYYELVQAQLIMQEAKEYSIARPGLVSAGGVRKLQAKAIRALPFELTKDQKQVTVDLNKSLSNQAPSYSLLNADVGAGKTIVAQLACLKAVESGYQAVLLGPTEELARQLHETFERVVKGLQEQGEEVRLEFFSGGLKAKERKEKLARIASGEVDVVIGTHAVLSDAVVYSNLGFVSIDEQQKFGAEQRTKLLHARGDGSIPDLLLQTATPIPRTMAQAMFGEIQVFELKEKPPGRLPIETEWIEEHPMELLEELINPLWNDIRTEAAAGNQTFVISPLVHESEKIDAASVTKVFELLSTSTLRELKVGYVHGQMKGDDLREQFAKFRRHEYDVLVSSTVVEVGIDIPDATRVVIMSAERLGASSLHQIRGRVGRNSKQSKCYLVSSSATEQGRLRLQSLVDSENGFDIATADLALRGEGQMFSSVQSGRSEMIFASFAKHRERIPEAIEEAARILKSPFKALAVKESKEKFNADERLF
jgi:ATP-dependent DNA helicase RecG